LSLCDYDIEDACLEPVKYEVLKMLDLQTKSAVNSDKLQVQHYARSQQLNTGFGGNKKTKYTG
jgi:hypothetical protein